MEEEDNIIVKLAQEDVETSYNLLNNNDYCFSTIASTSLQHSRGPEMIAMIDNNNNNNNNDNNNNRIKLTVTVLKDAVS